VIQYLALTLSYYAARIYSLYASRADRLSLYDDVEQGPGWRNENHGLHIVDARTNVATLSQTPSGSASPDGLGTKRT
jgi:hypothetical protein